MRIARVKLTKFRRFEDLEIRDIPSTAKLVVLAGPNGSGKSSLFDAFLLKYKYAALYSWNQDTTYYNKNDEKDKNISNKVNIDWHGGQLFARGSLYVRTAYRNESAFQTTTINRQGSILDQHTLHRLIDQDATASLRA
jgi:recombinational DNA repair ATPase RecF